MKRLVTPKYVSEMLSVPVNTLRNWRNRRVGPQWVKLEGTILYDLAAVEQYLEDKLNEASSVRAHIEEEVKRHVSL